MVDTQWSPGAFERAKMRPMPNPTWDSMLALPEETEVLCIFIIPMVGAVRGMQFFMDATNRENIIAMRDGGKTPLPAHVAYVLPEIVVPDPSEFFTPRKDADA